MWFILLFRMEIELSTNDVGWGHWCTISRHNISLKLKHQRVPFQNTPNHKSVVIVNNDIWNILMQIKTDRLYTIEKKWEAKGDKLYVWTYITVMLKSLKVSHLRDEYENTKSRITAYCYVIHLCEKTGCHITGYC